MGRHPTPTALRVLTGNPQHRPLRLDEEPQPVIGLVEPPAHLDADARRFWMAQGPELVKLGTLGESDGPLFALLCERHSQNIWLSRRIDELRSRPRLNAREEKKLAGLEGQRLRNAAAFQKLAAEFGLGAAARTRIRLRPKDLGQGELDLGEAATLSPLAQAFKMVRS